MTKKLHSETSWHRERQAKQNGLRAGRQESELITSLVDKHFLTFSPNEVFFAECDVLLLNTWEPPEQSQSQAQESLGGLKCFCSRTHQVRCFSRFMLDAVMDKDGSFLLVSSYNNYMSYAWSGSRFKDQKSLIVLTLLTLAICRELLDLVTSSVLLHFHTLRAGGTSVTIISMWGRIKWWYFYISANSNIKIWMFYCVSMSWLSWRDSEARWLPGERERALKKNTLDIYN